MEGFALHNANNLVSLIMIESCSEAFNNNILHNWPVFPQLKHVWISGEMEPFLTKCSETLECVVLDYGDIEFPNEITLPREKDLYLIPQKYHFRKNILIENHKNLEFLFMCNAGFSTLKGIIVDVKLERLKVVLMENYTDKDSDVIMLWKGCVLIVTYSLHWREL